MNLANIHQPASFPPPGGLRQALTLAGLFVGNLLLFGLIGAGISRLSPFTDIVTLHIVQNISTAGSFLLPAWLFAYLTAPDRAAAYLGCRPVPAVSYALGLAAFLTLIPWINALTNWNMDMLRPWQNSGIGLFFKQMSDKNEQLLQLFLNKTDAGSLCLNLFTLALMPAVCEEFFFRGGLQRYLTAHARRPQAGIWISAFIFSLLHFDPIGFLPRLFLGAFLGYVFAASRSLYPGILLHFLNNASVVTAYYLYGNGLLQRHPESFSENWHWWSTVPGLILTAGLVRMLYRYSDKKAPA